MRFSVLRKVSYPQVPAGLNLTVPVRQVDTGFTIAFWRGKISRFTLVFRYTTRPVVPDAFKSSTRPVASNAFKIDR